MIDLKFSQFMSRRYDDHDETHQLYVLQAAACVLYVGISRSDVWGRWFQMPTSHLFRVGKDRWRSNSEAGRAVLECYPESKDWTIQLWTVDDCIQFLGLESRLDIKRAQRDIFFVENLMINKLKPALNVAGTDYQAEASSLPECVRRYRDAEEKEMGRLYRKMFK